MKMLDELFDFLSDSTLETIVLVLFFIIFILFIGVMITQWAWNTVMPYLFNLPSISIWQALAITLLIGAVSSIFRR